MKTGFYTKVIMLLILGIGITLWLWAINYPYVGLDNANNNYLALASRNYLRFGVIRLRFFPTYFAGETLPSPVNYYLHHPILMFLLAVIPFRIFGFSNWVIHVVPFLFMATSMYLIYLVGSLVWNKRVGMLAGLLAVLFPMTSFYWKYIFFEQISLFWILLILYFFIRYLRESDCKYLTWIFIFSFLLILSDWSGLYLLFPFVAVYAAGYQRQKTGKAILAWGLASLIGLCLFLVAVFLTKGNYADLATAIWTRSLTSELLSKSFWPVRLLLLVLIRVIVYFTPLALFSGIYFGRLLWGRDHQTKLQKLILSFFFIFGVLNIIFLPTSTWGLSYFLFYLIPFFALCGGVLLTKIENRKWLFWGSVIGVVISSIVVNYFKIQQLKKQEWKYPAAQQINLSLPAYVSVGNINFPGDLFENYFLHPSIPMNPGDELSAWLSGRRFPAVWGIVFACVDKCSAQELRFIETMKTYIPVKRYTIGGNSAWLIRKKSNITIPALVNPDNRLQPSAVSPSPNPIVVIYRFIRNFIGVYQI